MVARDPLLRSKCRRDMYCSWITKIIYLGVLVELMVGLPVGTVAKFHWKAF